MLLHSLFLSRHKSKRVAKIPINLKDHRTFYDILQSLLNNDTLCKKLNLFKDLDQERSNKDLFSCYTKISSKILLRYRQNFCYALNFMFIGKIGTYGTRKSPVLGTIRSF